MKTTTPQSVAAKNTQRNSFSENSILQDEARILDTLLCLSNKFSKDHKLYELGGKIADSHYELREKCLRRGYSLEQYRHEARQIIEKILPDFQRAVEAENLMSEVVFAPIQSQAMADKSGPDLGETYSEMFEKINLLKTSSDFNAPKPELGNESITVNTHDLAT